MASGEVSDIVGVSTRTLRYYEEEGAAFVPARTASGYRRHPCGPRPLAGNPALAPHGDERGGDSGAP
ncbi:MAG: MerR family transcriptional regulator [Collinsella sp.]